MSLTIDLPEEVETRLRQEAARRGRAPEEVVCEIVRDALPVSTGESILSIFRPGWSQITDDDWNALPNDLSSNLDHYLYGSGKDRS